jgi:hypothetical protein
VHEVVVRVIAHTRADLSGSTFKDPCCIRCASCPADLFCATSAVSLSVLSE